MTTQVIRLPDSTVFGTLKIGYPSAERTFKYTEQYLVKKTTANESKIMRIKAKNTLKLGKYKWKKQVNLNYKYLESYISKDKTDMKEYTDILTDKADPKSDTADPKQSCSYHNRSPKF